MPAHSELRWLLSGTARMGWLNRMTQWKDKAGKNREGAQRRAVHLSRAAGRRRAALPGDARAGRRRPEAASGAGARHRDQVQHRFRGRAVHPARAVHLARPRRGSCRLRDGAAKMSKSDPSDAIADQPDRCGRRDRAEVPQGARPIPSRCPTSVDGLAERPEARNLVTIYAALADSTPDDGARASSPARASARSSPRSPTSRWRRSARSATG